MRWLFEENYVSLSRHVCEPYTTNGSGQLTRADELEMLCFSSERAAWRWAHDRAAIASRWSWLSAQIHDLECRIRQNKEVNKQIRLGKGSVTLAGDEPPRLCDSVVVNGYHGPLPGETGKVIDEELVPNDSCRTRPFLRSSFRKRKLLRTAGLHLTSKRAAKSSTVQCGCHPPLPSCVLCTGRPNPTLPRQDNDLLTVNERIALLDPAFHPVLSLPRGKRHMPQMFCNIYSKSHGHPNSCFTYCRSQPTLCCAFTMSKYYQ